MCSYIPSILFFRSMLVDIPHRRSQFCILFLNAKSFILSQPLILSFSFAPFLSIFQYHNGLHIYTHISTMSHIRAHSIDIPIGVCVCTCVKFKPDEEGKHDWEHNNRENKTDDHDQHTHKYIRINSSSKSFHVYIY